MNRVTLGMFQRFKRDLVCSEHPVFSRSMLGRGSSSAEFLMPRPENGAL